MNNITASAEMYPVRKRLSDNASTYTSLRSVCWADLINSATSAFSLVAEFADKASPSSIAYMFSQSMILNHSFNVKVFNGNIAKIVDYKSADFMMKVSSLVSNSFMQSCDFQSHFVSLGRANSSHVFFPLKEFEPLLAPDKVSWIGYACSVGQGSKVFQANVNADFGIVIGMNDISVRQFTRKNSKPLAGWSSFDSQSLNLTFWNSVEYDWQIANLADFNVFAADELEPGLGICNAIIPVLSPESWVASIRLCKKLNKRVYNPIIDILKNLGVNFFKLRINHPQVKNHGVKVFVRKVCSFILIPYNLVFKLLVVKQPAYLDVVAENFRLLF